VLAEATLHFCWLMKVIFEEADPKPQALRLTVGFDNLTRPSGSATLRDLPEGRVLIGFERRDAPAERLEVYLITFQRLMPVALIPASTRHQIGTSRLCVAQLPGRDPGLGRQSGRLRRSRLGRRLRSPRALCQVVLIERLPD
jgi:hypothetical protein